MATTKNRRLRKKLRLGEFAEKGFEVVFSLRPEVPEVRFFQLGEAFLGCVDIPLGRGLNQVCGATKPS